MTVRDFSKAPLFPVKHHAYKNSINQASAKAALEACRSQTVFESNALSPNSKIISLTND